MKRKNIKKLFLTLLCCFLLCGCNSKKVEEVKKNYEVKKVSDYVVSVPEYNEVNDEEAIAYINNMLDGWNKEELYSSIIPSSGCTSLAKVLDNNDTIIARNMDLNITNKPEIVFYIDEPNKYRSFNVSYIPQLTSDYEDMLEEGISSELYTALPYIISDTLNEKGLALEINMRSDEYDTTTGELINAVSSTNPNASTRLTVHGAMRYLSDNAATVEESLKILGAINYQTKEKYGDGEIDVYSVYTQNLKWNYAVQIADATGEYGLLEFVDNKVIYYPKQKSQANYYLASEYRKTEKYAQGEGRTKYIEDNYSSIHNIYDAMSIMRDLRYSNSYNKNALFDATSEYAGLDIFEIIETLEQYKDEYHYEIKDYSNLKQTFYDLDSNTYVVLTKDNYKNYPNRYNVWSTSFVLDSSKNSEVKAFMNWYSDFYNSLDYSQIRNLGIFWNTAHSITFNCTQKYAILTFYEDEATTKVFSFE